MPPWLQQRAQGSDSTPQGEGQGTPVKAKGSAGALQPRPHPAHKLPRPVVLNQSAERGPARAPGGWVLAGLRPRGQRGPGGVLAQPGASSALTVQTGTARVSVVPSSPAHAVSPVSRPRSQWTLCVVTLPTFPRAVPACGPSGRVLRALFRSRLGTIHEVGTGWVLVFSGPILQVGKPKPRELRPPEAPH